MSEGPNPVLIGFLVLLALGAGIGIFFAVKRHRYVKAIRERGWVFDSSPSPEVANGLLVPPFGVGFRRGTDEHIVGRTRSGLDFQVFEYQAAGDARVVCMPLGIPLPELVATAPGQSRQGVIAQHRGMLPGGGLLLGADAAFTDAFMAVAGGPMSAFATRFPLNLSVDGDQLTQIGAPKDPDELEVYLEALAPVAGAVRSAAPQLEPFRQPQPERRLGFYHRPSWYYLASDDGLLSVVQHTGGGMNHRTSDVVHGEFLPGAWFVAFVHHWQTQRTETYTDSNGHTQTRTVTENHSEVIHEISLPFASPDLQVTNDSRWGRLFNGASIDFELAAFNDAYDVRSSVPKFAHDVLHPRQIEYLMAIRTMPFTISGGKVRTQPPQHSAEVIAFELDVLAGFFARWPAFVWQDLGVATPPVKLAADGQVEVFRG
ncbi:hypothetical protein [Pseudactinotalea suaedae]|uniref:hypothetical protein n=1 Tax=Pseudactinotalea suaedae TaxID=1524924 RepID=UPI0012E14D5B|nr:hypothetical protein [Pseudactinotalea suaedae]